jgi:hypothetical protein
MPVRMLLPPRLPWPHRAQERSPGDRVSSSPSTVYDATFAAELFGVSLTSTRNRS